MQRSTSRKGLSGLVSPVNSDLMGVPGAEDLVIDLVVQPQQMLTQPSPIHHNLNKLRQNSSKENLNNK